MERWLPLELASTIRHDGNGGVADDLTTLQGLVTWLRDQQELLPPPVRAGDSAAVDRAADERTPGEPAMDLWLADDELRLSVVELRRAVRALFAHAVRPAPPSPADARRLMPLDEALTHLNTTAAREAVVLRLDWPQGGTPAQRLLPTDPDPHLRLLAALARATIEFLAGPHRAALRACTAPRCVRYFVKSHGRQEWCKPSCGNRARAARHYQRHHSAT